MSIQTYDALKSAIQVTNNQVQIAVGVLTKAFDEWFQYHLNGQLLLNSDGEHPLITYDDQTQSVIIQGKANYRLVPNLTTLATFRFVDADNVQATIRFRLIENNAALAGIPSVWKFSTSFTDLPTMIDWADPRRDPRQSLLDALKIYNSYFVLTTAASEEKDAEFGVTFAQGLNFVSNMQPSFELGLLRNLLSDTQPIVIYGTIHIPLDTEIVPPVKPLQYPWTLENPPGINLKADLGLALSPGSMKFDGVHYQFYTPHSQQWADAREANATYQPLLGYTGTLSIPSANITIHISALTDWNGPEVLLATNFEGLSLGNLGLDKLEDLAGTNQLAASLPDEVKNALSDLQITYAAIHIGYDQQARRVTVSDIFLAVGMPNTPWKIWDDHFEISGLVCRFTVEYPFPTADQQRDISVMLLGKFKVVDVPFNFYATNKDGYMVYAELAEAQTVDFNALLKEHKLGIDLPTTSSLAINGMTVSVAPKSFYAMSLALADDPKFTIDIGNHGLTISDVALNFTKPQSGDLTGSIGGMIAFGGFTLAMSYDLPGSFTARAMIFLEKISLSDLISTLIDQRPEIPDLFDLTFDTSSVVIQYQSGDNRRLVFQFGTHLEHFGSFVFEARKISTWEFAAAFKMDADLPSTLPGLGDMGHFIEMFKLEQFMIAVASFTDANFKFPELASFQTPLLPANTSSIQLPQGQTTQAGLYIFAQARLDADQVIKTLSDYLGLKDKLHIEATIGVALFVSKQPTQNSSLSILLPDCKINKATTLTGAFGARFVDGTFGAFLTGKLQTTVSDNAFEFDVTMVGVANGIFISGTLVSTNAAKPITFTVEGVTIILDYITFSLGVDFEGMVSIGFATALSIDTFDSSLAVFFNSAEPAQSLMAGSVSGLSLRDIVDTFANVPTDIDQILETVSLEGIEVPGTWTTDLVTALETLKPEQVRTQFQKNSITLPSGDDSLFISSPAASKQDKKWYITAFEAAGIRHYEVEEKDNVLKVWLEPQFYAAPQATLIGTIPFAKGFFISAKLTLLTWYADVQVQVSTQGIAASAYMAPIQIGHISDDLWLFSLTDSEEKGGPQIDIASFAQPQHPREEFRVPHLFVDGKLQLLGISVSVLLKLTTSRFDFTIKADVLSLVRLEVDGHFANMGDLGISGSIYVGVDTITLPGGLGEIKVDTRVQGTIGIAVAGSVFTTGITNAAIVIGGDNLPIPDLQLQVDKEDFTNVPGLIKSNLEAKIREFLKDVENWARWVANKAISEIDTAIDNLINLMISNYPGLTKEAAMDILVKVGLAIAAACPITTALSHL